MSLKKTEEQEIENRYYEDHSQADDWLDNDGQSEDYPSDEDFEILARESFVPTKNKKGEPYTQLVGQNPNGWRKHVNSFKAGYITAIIKTKGK